MSEVLSKTVVGGGSGKTCSAMSSELSPTVKLVAEPATLPNLENEQKHGIMKDQVEDDALKINDAFVVCDMDGGTVDLISYEVQQVEPLKVKERVIGDGPLQNSMLLDKSFQANIETIVGEAQRNGIKQGDCVKRVKNFDYGIKRTLSEKNGQTYAVDLQGLEREHRGNGGNHTATATIDALRVVFDDLALQIQQSLSEQIARVSGNALSIKVMDFTMLEEEKY